ncbi:hypothetical protein TRICI_001778 [Trichomonascus ciferrii]|uniref:Methyltransferase TRM13 domain-containing protein n=1 Tax=Trichomonascus ciferrii TaxID=44093 RepID=A0A642VCE7_9ASCO|nr:hypothetical protein TRICI_001778 [Trichomonascus ciferrii]
MDMLFDTVVRDSLECWLEFSNQLDEELEYNPEDDRTDFEYNSEEENKRWLEYNEEKLRVKFTSSYGHEAVFSGEEFCSRIDSGGARFWLEQVTAIDFTFGEGKVYEECCEILRKIVGEFKICLKELKVVSYTVDGEVYSGLSGIMERARGDSRLVREKLFSYPLTDTKAVVVGNRVSELLINDLDPSPKYIFAELEYEHLSELTFSRVSWNTVADVLRQITSKAPSLKKMSFVCMRRENEAPLCLSLPLLDEVGLCLATYDLENIIHTYSVPAKSIIMDQVQSISHLESYFEKFTFPVLEILTVYCRVRFCMRPYEARYPNSLYQPISTFTLSFGGPMYLDFLALSLIPLVQNTENLCIEIWDLSQIISDMKRMAIALNAYDPSTDSEDVVEREGGTLETEILNHPGLEERLKQLENQKHAVQQASLVDHMEKHGFLNPRTTIIAEFGCKRGELSRYISLARALKDMDSRQLFLVIRPPSSLKAPLSKRF